MENLNAEQIKKALECCYTPLASDCNNCGYRGRSVENGEYIGCTNRLIKDALALINSQEQRIKELGEKNERLQKLNASLFEDNHILSSECIPMAKADTVRKMQELIKERCIKGGIYPAFVASTIDEVAKEMLEVAQRPEVLNDQSSGLSDPEGDRLERRPE